MRLINTHYCLDNILFSLIYRRNCTRSTEDRRPGRRDNADFYRIAPPILRLGLPGVLGGQSFSSVNVLRSLIYNGRKSFKDLPILLFTNNTMYCLSKT